jgi:aspartyl-tRNA(Asn)/glutamyl-tRNA(Gln) amidotransferase subunit A
MQMQAFFDNYDLLLTPSLPIAAFSADQQVADLKTQRSWIDWTPFTYPFNLTRQPAASMPCGFTSGGLPVGLQIIGPLNSDALVLRCARAYERLHPIVVPKEPISRPTA